MAIVKNKTTKDNRDFWSHVEEVAHEVSTWPDWMCETRAEQAPRHTPRSGLIARREAHRRSGEAKTKKESVGAMSTEIPVHPVQTVDHRGGKCPQVVTMLAYEVYCRLYGEQQKLVEGSCRGGFRTGELIAFLYAHSFPREQWDMRVQ